LTGNSSVIMKMKMETEEVQYSREVKAEVAKVAAYVVYDKAMWVGVWLMLKAFV